MTRVSNQPDDDTAGRPDQAGAPGVPSPPAQRGLVDDAERDVSERPQADPEVPELGEWDKQRDQQPAKDSTGF